MNMNATKTKIALKLIKLTNVGTPKHPANAPFKCLTWQEAEAKIEEICAAMGANEHTYQPVVFQIEWEDGKVYGGRYEARNPFHPLYRVNLAGHVRRNLESCAGLQAPDSMNAEAYEIFLEGLRAKNPGFSEEALGFLTTYSLVD